MHTKRHISCLQLVHHCICFERAPALHKKAELHTGQASRNPTHITTHVTQGVQQSTPAGGAGVSWRTLLL